MMKTGVKVGKGMGAVAMKGKRKSVGMAVLGAAALVMTAVMPVKAKGVADYTDVGTGDWFYNYVSDVSSHELMTGMNDTTFGPGENLARGQFATVLYRMAGSQPVDFAEHFPDVPGGQFYSIPVTWANSQEIVSGYGNGYFGVGDNITREQMATMLYRYAQKNGQDVTASGDYGGFRDGYKVTDFASDAMRWAIGRKIISGNADGTLDPQGNVSRAVCATMISRYVGGTPGTDKVWVVDKPAWTEERQLYIEEQREFANSTDADISQLYIDTYGMAEYVSLFKGTYDLCYYNDSLKCYYGTGETITLPGNKELSEKYVDFIYAHCGGWHTGDKMYWFPVKTETISHPEEGHWEYKK